MICSLGRLCLVPCFALLLAGQAVAQTAATAVVAVATPVTSTSGGIIFYRPSQSVWQPYAGTPAGPTPVTTVATRLTDRYNTHLSLSFDVTNGIVAPVGPSRVRVPFGENVTLTALPPVSGSLQWTKNGTAIPGATSVSLTLPNASRADRGHYTVTGDFGPNVFSPGVRLDVVQQGQLANYSARLQLAADGTPQIVGAVIDGDQRKALLLRAVGPTLNDLGVKTAARPTVKVFSTSGQGIEFPGLARSDALAEITAAAGAFPLTAPSGDYVVVISLSPGPYTFQVSDTSGQGGLSLFEIYEVTDPLL